MIKKQKLTIIFCAVFFVILIVVFFAVINPLLTKKEEAPPELLPGEVLSSNNKIMIFEYTDESQMFSIEVKNSNGKYMFYRGYDGDNANFYIKGKEGAPYSLEAFSALVVSAGNSVTIGRLDDVSTDLSVYGLSEEDDPAWYILTKKDGTKHKVYIGDLILTGGGYYCRYEGRDAVYVVDASISTTLLADVKTMITPGLGYSVSSSDYSSIKNFIIIKDGRQFLSVDTAKEGEDGTVNYNVKFPEGMKLNTDSYSQVLQSLYSFVGTETVECGEEITATLLKEEYGIDTEAPYYMIGYTVNDVVTAVMFSEPDKDGNMYAFTTLYNLVAKINKTSIAFMDWDIFSFVNASVFSDDINDVKRISIRGEVYVDGKEVSVNSAFVIKGEKSELAVIKEGNDSYYGADDTMNFRNLYVSILTVKLQGYAEETDPDNGKLIAEINIELDSGEKNSYKFYAYSTRQCLVTVNGKGEYYVLREAVEKILKDTDKMLTGHIIDPYEKN